MKIIFSCSSLLQRTDMLGNLKVHDTFNIYNDTCIFLYTWRDKKRIETEMILKEIQQI